MENIIFKKVEENSNQRFYEASIEIKSFPNESFSWKEEKEYAKKRIKEDYKDQIPESIKIICISDATTHTERLAFAGAKFTKKNGETFYSPTSMLQIDGKHTFMIDGGDERHVHPDEIYLKRIAKSNGFSMQILK